MSSRFPEIVLAGLVFAAVGVAAATAKASHRERVLRVCSDPNNLPFSNQREQGFENQIANLIARDFGAKLDYTWWAQRRGFIRNTLKAGSCDVIMGVPTGMDMVLKTAPYYRSSYVFVTRRDNPIDVRSFDDPVLRRVRVGVQLIGDDGVNSPPAHALRRGISDSSRPAPPDHSSCAPGVRRRARGWSTAPRVRRTRRPTRSQARSGCWLAGERSSPSAPSSSSSRTTSSPSRIACGCGFAGLDGT